MLTLIISILVVVIGALIELAIYLHQHNHNHKDRTAAKFDIGSIQFWALGDRVLIEEDEFRTGYECQTCGGKGKLPCSNCSGTGTTPTGKKCSICDGTNGQLTCSDCQGKGGLIIAPETSQRRPTSGTIVSSGPGHYQNGVFVPNKLKVGQSVLYSNFAGYVVDLTRATGEKVTLRILHEPEVLSGMDGHLTLTNLRGKSEIASFSA